MKVASDAGADYDEEECDDDDEDNEDDHDVVMKMSNQEKLWYAPSLLTVTVLYKYREIVKKSKSTIFWSCFVRQNIVTEHTVRVPSTQGPYHAQTMHKKYNSWGG